MAPLLLFALFSGGVPPASAGGYENCNNCQNCVYNGRYWSCKDPPGLVKDRKSDKWWLALWVLVILVSFQVVSEVMRKEGVFVPDEVLMIVVGLALVSVVLAWMGIVPGEVMVILVGPALVLVVMKWMVPLLQADRYCPMCKRMDAMEMHGVSDKNPDAGRVKWVCKYCEYKQWRNS